MWLIFVIILPFLGVFVYLIARGGKMGQRDMAQAAAQQAQFNDYVRNVAATSSTSTADELTKLSQLKDQGVITDAEFAAQKAKILAAARRPAPDPTVVRRTAGRSLVVGCSPGAPDDRPPRLRLDVAGMSRRPDPPSGRRGASK